MVFLKRTAPLTGEASDTVLRFLGRWWGYQDPPTTCGAERSVGGVGMPTSGPENPQWPSKAT